MSREVSDLYAVIDEILDVRRRIPVHRAVLAAFSGIDGCGKGHLTAKVADRLRGCGMRVAGINVDGWLNLPHRRFNQANPAEHFYLHAIRFDEMFAQLILPLRDHRSVCVEMDFVEETATEYRRHAWAFEDIDIIVLEGIYLLKRAFQDRYDLSCWIDCSFETALDRAVARSQEGLPPEETTSAYRTIYFPAQQIHFLRDVPRDAATLVVKNDPRLVHQGRSSGTSHY